MSLVTKASESVKSLACVGQVGSGLNLQALEAQVDELLTNIQSGSEAVRACRDLKLVCPPPFCTCTVCNQVQH